MAIKRCNCENAYMDKKYGKGKRVFNTFKTQNGEGSRCTVCGADANSGSTRRKR